MTRLAENISERSSSTFQARVVLLGAVHGSLSLTGDRELASLLVFECRFLSLRAARRIISIAITTTFKASSSGGNELDDEAPKVLNFSGKIPVHNVSQLCELAHMGRLICYPRALLNQLT
jgi:hypothetical protein